MRILVDQDGVIANFEDGLIRGLMDRNITPIPLKERRNFKAKDDYPYELSQTINEIITSPGFYRNLNPLEGAIQSLKELASLGHEVFVCTSPLGTYDNCVLEKYHWVEKHIGGNWINRLILTKDKTLINGDILIDDNPLIKGVAKPSWKQVIYDQPYNKHIECKKRFSWDMGIETLMGYLG